MVMRAFAARALVPPPFPSGSHADARRLAEAALSWANTIGLTSTPAGFDRLRRAHAAELAARACPDAPYDRVLLLAELVTWLFAFDDRCDEDELGTDPGRLAPVITPLLDTLDQLGRPVAEPVGAAARGLDDLCRRVRALDRPTALLRFTTNMRQYLVALLWEASNRQQKRVPRLTEYIQMRRHTGAVLPSLTLTDLVGDGFPGSRDRVRPAVARLDLLAADLVCWCNDVFSYGKELGHGGHNLAAVIAADTGCGEGAALEEAAARFNAGLDVYARLEADVLDDADPTLTRMVDARRRWLRGTYDWSMGADRYV
jgi:hypothetical protein